MDENLSLPHKSIKEQTLDEHSPSQDFEDIDPQKIITNETAVGLIMKELKGLIQQREQLF